MTRFRFAAAVLTAASLSSLVVACGGADEDTGRRAALEQEALQRDLDLALQPDTTAQPSLADTAAALPPLVDSVVPAPQASAPPAPAPARPRAQAPRRPAPEPAPSRPAEDEGPRYASRTAHAGTSFSVAIDQELSTKRMNVGDVFTATLTEDITDEQGRTVIPAGATVNGRITAEGGREGGLRVAFTSISSGGERYSIDGSVTDQPNTRRVNRTSGRRTAATVGGGAAAGAILGRVIGKNTRSTVAGAVVGAAAGTAVAMGTADVDTVVDAGSRATIRLDGPVTVRRRID